MKLLLSLVVILITTSVFSQNIDEQKLSQDEISGLFTEAVKSELGIEYPIFRVYSYKDEAGQHFLTFTERSTEANSKNPKNDKIKAFLFTQKDGKLIEEWTITDEKDNEKNKVTDETSIWFFTKYLKLNDIDKDGFVDPIIVYGGSGHNGTDDGRIVITVFKDGKKSQIHHQNGTLDFERETDVDASFYELPQAFQVEVEKTMELLESKSHAIFPAGWENSMSTKATHFDE